MEGALAASGGSLVLRGVLSQDWHVVVMTDQGLYAAWLYREIQANGWHPLMRVQESMGFCARGETSFQPVSTRLARRGRQWKGQGTWSEQGEQVEGTLLMCWERGYERPLAAVTDERETEAELAFYQMRFWAEDGFKDQKRGGWRWEQTKMSNPMRASRLWLAMAVTMLWGVRVGSEEEGREQGQHRRQRRKPPGKRGRPRKPFVRPRGREQSLRVRGQQSIHVAAIQGRVLPMGHVIADAWPTQFHAGGKPTANWKQKCQHRQKVRRDRHTTRTWKQVHQQHRQREHERQAKRQARQQQRREREHERQAKEQARLQCQHERQAKAEGAG